MVLNVYKVICPSGTGYLIVARNDGCAAVVACRLDKLDEAQAKYCVVSLRRTVHE
ncbi:MAG: hypothetical protein VB035_06055 [Candidatus Fimivivens sp.]|nr:hypothetical protein [Candidatus Fimivivens sp.]